MIASYMSEFRSLPVLAAIDWFRNRTNSESGRLVSLIIIFNLSVT